jgi:hypothetical protein
VGELTEKQMGYCTARYEEQIPVVLKAVQLDPRWFASWDELSAVAAFSSDEQVAHASFQKALSLSRGDPSVIRWGLQLYQPKWLGDRKELERVARTAASAAGGWSPGDRILTAYHVSCAGLTDRWQAVVRTPWERAAVQQTIDQDARGSRT